MAIEWDRVGQQAFDRHVEALLYQMFDGRGGPAIPVDGRGGDGGIDVKVVTDAGLQIFQLKYHPDGIAAGYKGRRAAIKKSFERAMRHKPVEWTLVVPCTLSNSDRTFVEGLARGRPVKVSVMDRAALDCGFAAHPDLEASFTRDHLREAARDFNMEQALLLDSGDLGKRVSALGVRSDTVDRHWTWDFHREDDRVSLVLRAKHSRAHEISPIKVTLRSRHDALEPALAAAVTRSVGFGVAEEVVFPSTAVESLSIDGPEFVAKTLTDVEVTWQPRPSTTRAGATVEAAFLDEDGTVAARYAGQLRTLGSGTLGASIDADVAGVRLQMMLPFDTELPATFHYAFDLDGLHPAAAMTTLRLHQRLRRGGTFRLTVDGIHAGTGTLPATGSPEDFDAAEKLLLYLDDLDVVQRHCETHFPAPLTYSGTERIELRVARLLVEGRCVVHPFAQIFTLTLTGEDDPFLRAVLSGDPQCLRVDAPAYEVTLGGHTLNIGHVRIFHTRIVAADNGREVLEALDAGRAANLKVELRPLDGQRLRFYLPAVPDDGTALVPVPLGLPGFAEPT